jgi:AcrR family transcriptional regulator
MKETAGQAEPEQAARERLLTAALELFNSKGYAAASVREIVEKAGVTKPVLYYYFRNKEGLYLELLNSSFSSFDAMAGEITAFQGHSRERITRLSEMIFDGFVANLPVIRLAYGIYFGPPQGAPHFNFDAYHDKMYDTFYSIVTEGISRGELRDVNPREITWTIICILNQTMEEQLCHASPRTSRDDLLRFLNHIFEGIQA